MAKDLKVEIIKSKDKFGDKPVWYVRIVWIHWSGVEGDELHKEPVRMWSVIAPSELVAKTLQTALNNITDEAYEELMSQGFER